QAQQQARKVETELADRDVVHGVLVGQVDVSQNLRAVAGAERVGSKRVVGYEARDRLEDHVIFRVAGHLEYVGLVFHSLAEKGTQLETGDPFAQIEGPGRRAHEIQGHKTDKREDTNTFHALPSMVPRIRCDPPTRQP